ncbi:MAG: hypothetical protein JWP35_1053 [Caulobacter sp.]|nr:hypothetical protein [Caulobacter sp.]
MAIPADTIACRTDTLSLTFEPTDCEDRFGSICFDIHLAFESPRQALTWECCGVWIAYDRLLSFEAALGRGRAALMDMGDHQIICLVPVGAGMRLSLNPPALRVSNAGAVMTVSLLVEREAAAALAAAFKAYPRWW